MFFSICEIAISQINDSKKPMNGANFRLPLITSITRTVLIDTSHILARKISMGTITQWNISGLMPRVSASGLFIVILF